ncbi:nuclease-related domain-containing protein [Clostridium cibarium]|uniref:NERD domain-containing protein n=1 Tax=Clostridium cibarium TaxID=2762247 RepID=A0ABR8PP21_9CLOT|nr:nuclease-related domain-containing protein [Clostridium cibarium]MBD7909917.1 NERD domain-containing protein [Clostridium cibarium]
MISIVKRGVSFLYAFITVYFIYSLSIVLLKVGFDGASREIFFSTLAIYLSIPIVNYNKAKGNIVSGLIEENYKITKEVEKLKEKANIMEGVILKDRKSDFKIENIVVTNRGVFNIVKCNYKGDLEIKKNNRWYKHSRNGINEVISPITEVRKNRNYLAKILDEEFIIDLIVIVNDRAFLIGEENSDVPVVRSDELYNYISEYLVEEEINEDKIYDKIYEKVIKVNNIQEEKELYNKFVDNIWTFRGRLIFISVFFVLYLFNVAYMQKV